MVNFDDNTIARNKKEIQELTTLQRRYQTINAIKEYKTEYYKTNTEDQLKLGEIQGALISLYYEIDSAIEKDLNKKKQNATYTTTQEILTDIGSEKPEEVFRAWNYINHLLYQLHLTQLDSTKDINWENPEEVNQEHDL